MVCSKDRDVTDLHAKSLVYKRVALQVVSSFSSELTIFIRIPPYLSVKPVVGLFALKVVL